MLANSKHHQLVKIWNTIEKGRFWEMQRPALKMMIQIDFQQLESHNGGDTLESGDSRPPKPSMYGIFTYIWLIFMVNVGKYSIHGWQGQIFLDGFSAIDHWISRFHDPGPKSCLSVSGPESRREEGSAEAGSRKSNHWWSCFTPINGLT